MTKSKMEETPQVEAQENVQGLEVIKVDFSDFKNVEIVDSGDFKFIQLDADGDYFRGVFAGLPNSAKIDGFNFVLLEDFTNGKTLLPLSKAFISSLSTW